MATGLPLDVGSGSRTTPPGDGVQEPLKAAAAADEKSDIPPMTASQKRNRLRKIAERQQSSAWQASVEERLEYVEKLLGDSADKHAKWEQAHAEVEGAIVDLSDGFEMLRKRLEELCRTVPEQEEVDQVWSSIHAQAMKNDDIGRQTETVAARIRPAQVHLRGV